jgi:hypothetical protein
VFGLREPQLVAALDTVREEFSSLDLSEAVGNRVLVYDSDPKALAWNVLDSHYGNIRELEGFPTRQQWLDSHPDLAAVLKRPKGTQETYAPEQEIAA